MECFIEIPDYNGTLSLYRVGNSDAVFDEVFQNSGLDLDISDENAFRLTCSAVEGFVFQHNIEPVQAGVAHNGRVYFKGVPDGMYLLSGTKFETELGSYFVVPAISIVDDNSSIECKFTFVKKSEPQSLTVRKVWVNSDGESEVHVDLLKDEDVFDSVVLNADCNWEHVWPSLSVDSRWTVVEKDVLDGYKCSVEADENVVTITNTLQVAEPTPTPVSTPTPVPDPDATPDPTPPVSGSSSEPPVSPSPAPVEPTTEPLEPTEVPSEPVANSPVTGLGSNLPMLVMALGAAVLIGSASAVGLFFVSRSKRK